MRRIFPIIMLLGAVAVVAAPIDEAKRLYNEGRYDEALASLQALHRKTPRDGSVNYWLGATLLALDSIDEAVKYLTTAEERGVADASLTLARMAFNNYNPSEAATHYDTYDKLLRKNKRTVPEEIEEEQSRVVVMENMLARVESIAVIDSLTVDTEEFFKAYKLSPEAGRLIDGATARLSDVEMVFMPQNNTEIIYSQPDSAGNFVLMGAGILDDGSVDSPMPLRGENLNGGGNAEYPFMLSDGLTLYYASDGEGSLGGYDIFLTRRDEEGNFLQPQNIGMPYNSLDDDYLLAIDETTGAGWWATDRNHIPGKLTIYVFVPADTRVNVDVEDPNLISLARMSDISLSRRPEANYSGILNAIEATSETRAKAGNREEANLFELPIGSSTTVYHHLDDFKSSQARQLMTRAINARARINRLEERLVLLREAYRTGDTSTGPTILDLENELEQARREYNHLTNKAISTELSR